MFHPRRHVDGPPELGKHAAYPIRDCQRPDGYACTLQARFCGGTPRPGSGPCFALHTGPPRSGIDDCMCPGCSWCGSANPCRPSAWNMFGRPSITAFAVEVSVRSCPPAPPPTCPPQSPHTILSPLARPYHC